MHRSTGLCSVWLHLTTLIYALVPAARHRDILIILTAILKKMEQACNLKTASNSPISLINRTRISSERGRSQATTPSRFKDRGWIDLPTQSVKQGILPQKRIKESGKLKATDRRRKAEQSHALLKDGKTIASWRYLSTIWPQKIMKIHPRPGVK